jgi:G3E family GTPase
LQVSSVSLVIPGEMDLDKINYTLGALLNMRGEDIFRMKGILAIQHSELRWAWVGVWGAGVGV